MKTIGVLAVFVLFACPALAQPATVAVFPATVTDPNTATPIAAPVQYQTTCNVSPKVVEALPIVNPTEAYFDDPTDASKDCVVGVAAQLSALPDGSYKAALKFFSDPYGAISTAFSLSAAQVSHPCDGVGPTAGTVISGARTYAWCYPDNATGGSPITGWALYDNSTRTVIAAPSVTIGGTANTSGRRLYSMAYAATVGTHAIQVAPVNAVNEGNKSPLYTLTVQAPATAPVGTPDSRGVN